MDIPGETLETLMIPNITSDSGGEYTCIVSSHIGIYNASTFLFVYPYFLSHPDDVQVSVDSGVLLTCVAEGFPSPQYLWQRADGMKIRDDVITDRNYLSITSVQYGDAGEYYCIASGRGMDIQSHSSTITGIKGGIHPEKESSLKNYNFAPLVLLKGNCGAKNFFSAFAIF
jgi:hypothetical protein